MTCGKQPIDDCFEQINNIIYISLKSVQNVVTNDKHCFELYGYDVLIDNNLKPWLIEVNASPSVSPTTEPDRVIKNNLLMDVFRIVIPPEWFDEDSKHGANLCKETKVGFFDVIINEAEKDKKGEKGGDTKVGFGTGVKGAKGGSLWR